jgi:3D (Asp-Asp-Asp) domain-containing protein
MSKEGYFCVDCKKEYKCYTTLWNHNRIKHDGIKTVKSSLPEPTPVPEVINETVFTCKKCPKTYKHKQSRYNHEKVCTGTTMHNVELEIENKRIIALDKEQILLQTKKEVLELQLKIINDRTSTIIGREWEKLYEEEEKNYNQKEKQETQRKLRHFLLDLNQARIQSKF